RRRRAVPAQADQKPSSSFGHLRSREGYNTTTAEDIRELTGCKCSIDIAAHLRPYFPMFGFS
ncbi:MAG TPA: hypothetical protein VLC48_02520, partial [Gemmatimonadota bacterium]|nr:hypothetical protein [Gemmatimonadota bacterium]